MYFKTLPIESLKIVGCLLLLAGLESSTYADGNVTVTVSNGNLRVRGENNTPQDIIMNASGTNAGSFIFHNLDNTTTFNGQDSLTISGVDGKIRIDLGSGPKILIMTEGAAPGLIVRDDLQISSRGNDPALIILDTVFSLGRTRINTRNGDDAIILFNSQFEEQLRIKTGNGNDVVAGSDRTFAFDEYEVNAGNGRDYILLDEFDAIELDLRCGGQDDVTGIFDSEVLCGRINGNNGEDTLEVAGLPPGTLPFTIQSYEIETNGGSGAMFANARDDNPVYEIGVLLFQFLGLGL